MFIEKRPVKSMFAMSFVFYARRTSTKKKSKKKRKKKEEKRGRGRLISLSAESETRRTRTDECLDKQDPKTHNRQLHHRFIAP